MLIALLFLTPFVTLSVVTCVFFESWLMITSLLILPAYLAIHLVYSYIFKIRHYEMAVDIQICIALFIKVGLPAGVGLFAFFVTGVMVEDGLTRIQTFSVAWIAYGVVYANICLWVSRHMQGMPFWDAVSRD